MIWECANLFLKNNLPMEIMYYIIKQLEYTWQSLFLGNSKDLILSTIVEGGTSRWYCNMDQLLIIYLLWLLFAILRNSNGITMSYKYFFNTQPSCWNSFSSQHPLCTSSITVANFDNCYWIPAVLLCNAVIIMMSLEELGIKCTKVSLLPHLSQW